MSSPQHEPTMEEILASIRKIISEDAPAAEAPAAAAPPPPPPPAPPPAPAPEVEVLELTQEVVDTPVLEPLPVADDIVFQEPARDASPAPAGNNDIFSDSSRKALDDAFAGLDEIPEPEPAPRLADALPPSGASIEAVFERAVRDSFEPVLRSYLSEHTPAIIEGMKPLIREWMDEHFPPMLENAVRVEVERVVKARKR